MTIIPLREAIYHSKLVGSKSANLSVLLQHQIRTVDGIVIVAPYTRTDLQNVWNKMEGAAPLAVRSSMSSEDTEYSSAAGRYETILGVASFEEFVYAVHEVISSGYDAVNKAALVQPLIAGYCSGVLFTQSPISVNAMMIESIYGLGESLVSGKTTPDHFELNRETGVVVKERITNKKTHGIFVSPQPSLEIGHQVEYRIGKVRCTFSFGTKFIGSVSYRGQQSPSLSEEQLIGLYNLGIQLERIFGTPQDIEWTIDEYGICLLQTRPIVVKQQSITEKESLLQNACLEGFPASSGTVSGSVIQYEDLELQGAMKDHYIVVGYETSPKIIYHLNQVKGIVTEFGGMLCHAAIVAREFGIPCVVGVRGAMEVLQTGDVITVDGSQGLVFKGDEHGTLF